MRDDDGQHDGEGSKAGVMIQGECFLFQSFAWMGKVMRGDGECSKAGGRVQG
jgi:hypothetical protein